MGTNTLSGILGGAGHDWFFGLYGVAVGGVSVTWHWMVPVRGGIRYGGGEMGRRVFVLSGN